MRADDDRTPPERIRVTGLQEAQLRPLAETDRACAQMYYELGFDGAEVPLRREADFVALQRDHNVFVAEADHVVAGYAAWRDESPGVAYLADVSVHPDFQRFGVGSKLLESVLADGHRLRLEHAVVRCWERATWAMRFYAHHGFAPIDDAAPAKVLAWRDEHSAVRPLTRPGEVALWARTRPAPEPVYEQEDDGLPADEG